MPAKRLLDVLPATARDFEELTEILHWRRIELKMSATELKTAFNGERIGRDAFDKTISALGIELHLLPASAGCQNGRNSNALRRIFQRNRWVYLARKGAVARRAKMTVAEWKAFCRLGGLASAAKRAAVRKQRLAKEKARATIAVAKEKVLAIKAAAKAKRLAEAEAERAREEKRLRRNAHQRAYYAAQYRDMSGHEKRIELTPEERRERRNAQQRAWYARQKAEW